MSCSVQCGGKCCRAFPLNMSPSYIGSHRAELLAWREAGNALNESQRDFLMIAEMVIRIDEEGDETPEYTCSHFDTGAGLCTAYDERPAMCRDYPGYGKGSSCLHCGYADAIPDDLVQIISTKAAA